MVGKWMSHMRLHTFRHEGVFLNHAIESEGFRVFLLQSNYHIETEFYQKLRCPMIISLEMVSFGEKTLIFVQEIIDANSGEILAKIEGKSIRVDMSARKSTTFPQTFIRRYKHLSNVATSIEFLNPSGTIQPPSSFQQYSFTVRPSEIDWNGHVANYIYMIFCLDCVVMSHRNRNGFPRKSGDLSQQLTKSIQCVFLRECRLGDVINCCVWEDPSNANVLHFEIKRDAIVVYRSRIEYHPPRLALTAFTSNLWNNQ